MARRDRDRPLVVTLDGSIGQLSGGGFLTLAIRTRGPAANFKAAIEQEVRSVFPDPAVLRVQTSDDLISKVLTAERFGARFFGVYGAAAVLLGGGGLYALSRSLIARERRALGIRMALGARHGQLVFWIITTAVRPVAAGLLAGIGLSWVISRALLSIIPGYGNIGPVTYLIAGLVLAAAVTLALAISVRAISGLPPNEVLVAS